MFIRFFRLIFTLLIPGFLFSHVAFGQNDGKRPEKLVDTHAQPVDFPKNVIKFNPLTLVVFHGVTGSVERVLNSRTSFLIHVNARGLFSNAPNVIIQQLKNRDSEGGFDLGGLKLAGLDVGPTFRIYAGKKRPAPHGFFVELAIRYSQNEIEIPGEFETYLPIYEVDTALNSVLGATTEGFTIGVNVGAQFILWQKFSIECYVGAGLMSGNADILVNVEDTRAVSGEDRAAVLADVADEIANTINASPLKSWTDIFFTPNQENITAVGLFAAPVVRAGISFGFAF